jgi:hypothetical protein
MFHTSYRGRRDKFDTDSPTAVFLPDEATHAELEERLQTLWEWQKIRDTIDRYKQALRIACQEYDRLTAWNSGTSR